MGAHLQKLIPKHTVYVVVDATDFRGNNNNDDDDDADDDRDDGNDKDECFPPATVYHVTKK